jgi:hypothetical protein
MGVGVGAKRDMKDILDRLEQRRDEARPYESSIRYRGLPLQLPCCRATAGMPHARTFSIRRTFLPI